MKYTKCPYCGSKSGYYRKVETHQYYTFDGHPNGYESEYGDETKTAWCINCDKKLNISKDNDLDD